MSGWDQRSDNDEPRPDPDIEFRWLTAFTVIAIVGIILWYMWPRHLMTASNSSVQLSLKALRKDPRFTLVEVVERFISFPKPGHRSDLFGIIDVIAIGPGVTLAVQCTTYGGMSAHKRKLIDAPATRLVLEAGWQLELHCWRKPEHRWECRTLTIRLDEEDTDGREEESSDGVAAVRGEGRDRVDDRGDESWGWFVDGVGNGTGRVQAARDGVRGVGNDGVEGDVQGRTQERGRQRP